MGDKTRGLYRKFAVTRTDGSSAAGGKHDGCNYFVLDVTHDKHADAALLAYAASCEAEYPLLAADVRDLVSQPREPRTAPAPSAEPQLECFALLREAVAGLTQGACFTCGAEPGCNIDCKGCDWVARARRLLRDISASPLSGQRP